MAALAVDDRGITGVPHNGRGSIKVMAVTGAGALPLPDVKVKLEGYFDNAPYFLDEAVTDISGIAEFGELPAAPRAESLRPSPEHAGVIYKVTARHSLLGARSADIAVFDGVRSVWYLSSPLSEKISYIGRR